MSIDWKDPKSKVTDHFSVNDCINLLSWGRLATEDDGLTEEVKNNIIALCTVMEQIRTFLGNQPVHVHCVFRPEAYNKAIGGSTKSAHLIGKAMDFHIDSLSTNKGCDDIRVLLIPKLIEFNVRMEDVSDKTSRNWIHIDTNPPNPHRYFKP